MLPAFNMRQLLEAGVHFGHQSHRWNPKMAPFIFGAAQQHPHHRSGPDRAAAPSGAGQGGRCGGGARARAVRRHQAPGVRGHCRGCQALGAILHQSSLARRHADQLEDHLPVDPPPQAARGAAGRRRQGPHQEGTAAAHARPRRPQQVAGRHQGDGRAARPAVRHRHEQGRNRDRGSQEARHPHRCHRRHELQSRRHRFPDPGQR